MNAKELRIGNIIDAGNNTPSPVEWIMLDGNICTAHGSGYETEFDGIPLTEEWLIKFGFEKFFYDNDAIEEGYFLTKEFPVIGCLTTADNWEYVFDDETDTLRIKHVHSLQNLIHALTGTELEIKNN